MYNPFVKLTKSQKAAAEEYRHSPGLSLLYGFIILGGSLLCFALHFEFRLIDILSRTSMRDDTQSLSRIDQFTIKRQGDALEEKTKVNFGYQISDDKLELPRLAKQTLFVRVFPAKKFVAVYLPSKYDEYEIIIEKNLHSCFFKQGHGVKTCLLTAIKIFDASFDAIDKNPFINQTPYIYTDKFNNNPF